MGSLLQWLRTLITLEPPAAAGAGAVAGGAGLVNGVASACAPGAPTIIMALQQNPRTATLPDEVAFNERERRRFVCPVPPQVAEGERGIDAARAFLQQLDATMHQQHETRANAAVAAVSALARAPSASTWAALRQTVVEDGNILTGGDQVTGHPVLGELGRVLIVRATDRELLLLGLVLVRAAVVAVDRELLLACVHHPYFAEAALNAYLQSGPPEDDIWRLARDVDAAGGAYPRLLQELRQATSPAVQRWLLRDAEHLTFNLGGGFDGARCCLEGGRALAALVTHDVDDALHARLALLLSTLLPGRAEQLGGAALFGATPDAEHSFWSWPEAGQVLELFTERVAGRAAGADVDDLHYLLDLRATLDARTQPAQEAGLDEPRRERLAAQVAALLLQPQWRTRVEAELAGDDDKRFWRALLVAEAAGVDAGVAWEACARRSATQPRYLAHLIVADAERRRRGIELAERYFAAHAALTPDDTGYLAGVVGQLARHPGEGAALIERALADEIATQSALGTLEQWPAAPPASLRPALEAIVARNPDARRTRALLARA